MTVGELICGMNNKELSSPGIDIFPPDHVPHFFFITQFILLSAEKGPQVISKYGPVFPSKQYPDILIVPIFSCKEVDGDILILFTPSAFGENVNEFASLQQIVVMV
jgi:hypothetical protein